MKESQNLEEIQTTGVRWKVIRPDDSGKPGYLSEYKYKDDVGTSVILSGGDGLTASVRHRILTDAANSLQITIPEAWDRMYNGEIFRKI